VGEILEAHFYNIRLRKEGNSRKGRERGGKEPQPSLGREKKKETFADTSQEGRQVIILA